MNKYQGGKPSGWGYGNTQEKGSNANAAPAKVIGEPFHNPYTFIPFPKIVERYAPTPLSVDEDPDQRDRKSGVLEITVKTLSPLLTCSPEPYEKKLGHGYYKALTMGSDVIIPATGVRGSLRTLMTILSGGTLGYLDEDLWLTQGRDAQLGPNDKMPEVPHEAFLAEVVVPGSSTRPGKIRLGKTKLISADMLAKGISQLDGKRPTTGRDPLPYTDPDGTTWQVKLSGRPVNRKNKKEGLFQGTGKEITLREELWKEYQGRHRHSVQPELHKGDLVWLEPVDVSCKEITSEEQIQSIQWARWGRHGVKLRDKIPSCIVPDSLRKDGAVDMVTDLFGQVHMSRNDATFSGRIRPGNLVFKDCAGRVDKEVSLAPLAQPHPGCAAFYCDSDNLDMLSSSSPLKGYKVYRNTKERGENAPWKYTVQGVYVEKGDLRKPEQQMVNKTVDLLKEGCEGTVCISFRALADDELALLLSALTVDWKLGGGKPLGLGHCRVTGVTLINENGTRTNPLQMSDGDGNLMLKGEDYELVKHLDPRFALYRASQKPVDKLRYPRAVVKNQNRTNRAGLVWFGRHAVRRKNGTGLETIWTKGSLQSKAEGKTQIRAQNLPPLNDKEPMADALYGYDVVELDVDTSNRNQRIVGSMELFDRDKHAAGEERAGENLSQNRESREDTRERR